MCGPDTLLWTPKMGSSVKLICVLIMSLVSCWFFILRRIKKNHCKLWVDTQTIQSSLYWTWNEMNCFWLTIKINKRQGHIYLRWRENLFNLKLNFKLPCRAAWSLREKSDISQIRHENLPSELFSDRQEMTGPINIFETTIVTKTRNCVAAAVWLMTLFLIKRNTKNGT